MHRETGMVDERMVEKCGGQEETMSCIWFMYSVQNIVCYCAIGIRQFKMLPNVSFIVDDIINIVKH